MQDTAGQYEVLKKIEGRTETQKQVIETSKDKKYVE